VQKLRKSRLAAGVYGPMQNLAGDTKIAVTGRAEFESIFTR